MNRYSSIPFIVLRRMLFFPCLKICPINVTPVHLKLDPMTEINISLDNVIIFLGSHFSRIKDPLWRVYRKLNLIHKKLPSYFSVLVFKGHFRSFFHSL